MRRKGQREKDPTELKIKHQEQYFRKLNRQISATEMKLGISELEKDNIKLAERRKHTSLLSDSCPIVSLKRALLAHSKYFMN